ncbi:MAG: YciI-like protein [Acidimicrobiia bacterium]
MHWLLFYDYVDDMAERRAPFREAHLALAREARAAGALLAAGALVEPLDGAVLLFAGEDRAVAEEFAGSDPYVREGLVTRWQVRQWTVVVGGPWT